jgi:hypothetical protein
LPAPAAAAGRAGASGLDAIGIAGEADGVGVVVGAAGAPGLAAVEGGGLGVARSVFAHPETTPTATTAPSALVFMRDLLGCGCGPEWPPPGSASTSPSPERRIARVSTSRGTSGSREARSITGAGMGPVYNPARRRPA